MKIKISVEIPKAIADMLGEDPRNILLRAIVERALINQLLFGEKVTPRPEADEEMMNVVLEIDRKVKEEIARRYGRSGDTRCN